jgi:hypothetical protein
MIQHGNNSLSLLSPPPPSSLSPSSSSSSSSSSLPSYVFRPRRWQSIVCHTIRCYQQQQQQQMNKTINEKKDKEIANDDDDDIDYDSHELSLTSIIVLSQLSILRLWSHYLLPTCFHLLHQLHHVHHRQQHHQQQDNTNSMSASISLSSSSSSSSSFDHLWWWNHVMGIQTVALLATTSQLIQYVTCHWICRQYWKMWNHHDDGHHHQDNHDHDKNDCVAGDNHHPLLHIHDDIPYHHPQVHQSTFTNLSSYCTHHFHESVDHIIKLHINSSSSSSSSCCCSCCAYHPSTDVTWEEQLSHYQNHHWIGEMDVLLLLCNTPRRFTQWNHIYLLYSQYTQSHYEPQSFVSLSSLPSSSFSSSSSSLMTYYSNDQHINNTMMHPNEAAVAWWTSSTLMETIHALQYNGYGDNDDDDDEVDDPSSNEIHTMDQGNVEQPSHDQQQMMETLRHRLDFVCELSTR